MEKRNYLWCYQFEIFDATFANKILLEILEELIFNQPSNYIYFREQ